MPDDGALHHWLDMARERIQFQGLPARICWVGLGDRHRLGLAFNDMVRSGELKAPVVIGRDHLDSGSVASPNRETEAMRDGSDAVADWPLLNALLNTASGATWVSIHHGGGVGMGYSQHAGVVIVCDGTPEAARRIERVCGTIRRPASCAMRMPATKMPSPVRASINSTCPRSDDTMNSESTGALELGEQAAVARGTARHLSLGTASPSRRAALERARRSHEATTRIAAGSQPAYGINTGFGLLAQTRIAPEDRATLQRNIVLSHSAGVGPLLEDGIVRLVMVLKLASLLRGHSGVSEGLLRALEQLIDAEVYPCIPAQGLRRCLR